MRPDEVISYEQWMKEWTAARLLSGVDYHWLQRRTRDEAWPRRIISAMRSLGYDPYDANPRARWALGFQVAQSEQL